MEYNNNTSRVQDGLFKLGFVANLRNGAYIKELQELLNETEEEPTSQEIRERVNQAEILNLNLAGYATDASGVVIPEDKVVFRAFDSGYKTATGESIYGWFEKNQDNSSFTGVSWGTINQLRAYGSLRKTMAHNFHMGDFYFDNKESCEAFLDDIAKNTIPESWAFNNRQSELKHPILKSYLENIFIRLKREDKILRSDDGKYIMFNTNLLGIYSNDLYIIAEVRQAGDLEVYLHPIWCSDDSQATLRKYGFKGVHPESPVFFDDVNEVIFNTSWDIDKDNKSLSHIIEQRIERFPSEWRSKSPDQIARALKDAMNFAIAIAKRNYKYIVPIYYPRFDSISFLMPIFLGHVYTDTPDFALVLQTDRENKLYIARTILDVESGYQDARLIAKPDESWFNLAKLVKLK